MGTNLSCAFKAKLFTYWQLSWTDRMVKVSKGLVSGMNHQSINPLEVGE